MPKNTKLTNAEQPAITVKYTVNRPFKYGGRLLIPGETWTPRGRWDRNIANSRLVTRVETVEES